MRIKNQRSIYWPYPKLIGIPIGSIIQYTDNGKTDKATFVHPQMAITSRYVAGCWFFGLGNETDFLAPINRNVSLESQMSSAEILEEFKQRIQELQEMNELLETEKNVLSIQSEELKNAVEESKIVITKQSEEITRLFTDNKRLDTYYKKNCKKQKRMKLDEK